MRDAEVLNALWDSRIECLRIFAVSQAQVRVRHIGLGQWAQTLVWSTDVWRYTLVDYDISEKLHKAILKRQADQMRRLGL